MKIAEKFESIRICDDEKARRVLNVSTKQANITAEEIEAGVTIERLGEIGVPVFRYSTQVTIHGTIPDFNPEARPLGYKAVFRNQNGSLGVKYVAIDGEKKKLIVQASRLSKAASKLSAHLNSGGLELVFQTGDKETAIAQFKAFPRELIIGGIYAARGVFGDFYVVVDVGAVEQKNLFPLIGYLYGFKSQEELDAAQAKQEAEYAAARTESEAKWAAIKVEKDKVAGDKKAAALAELSKTHKPLAALPKGEFQFITVNDFGETWFYAVIKKPFGLHYTSLRYAPGVSIKSIEAGKKFKRWKDKEPFISKRVAAGQVFAA